MELRRLRYFVAVAEELSFTRAAERLHIAQPPLSIQIRALEQEIGARLFDRDQRHVYLTQAGKHLLDRARQILDSVEATKAEVRCAALGEVGALHLGYASSAMFTSSLTSAIKAFQIGFPHVLLTLHEMTSLDQFNGLHYRTLDAGILRKSEVPAPAGILVEEWYRAPAIIRSPRSGQSESATCRTNPSSCIRGSRVSASIGRFFGSAPVPVSDRESLERSWNSQPSSVLSMRARGSPSCRLTQSSFTWRALFTFPSETRTRSRRYISDFASGIATHIFAVCCPNCARTPTSRKPAVGRT